MNKSYKNMRDFWLDVKNLENRKGVIELGPQHISVAGVEMPFKDALGPKYVFVATNSLGDSSLYFENNSKSGVGGFIGGHGNEKLQELAARMLAHASKLTEKMTKGQTLPSPAEGNVQLFAVSKDGVFYMELPESEARRPENDFYPMFAYSQQVIGAFKEQTPSAQK